jgi:hypothetical protein
MKQKTLIEIPPYYIDTLQIPSQHQQQQQQQQHKQQQQQQQQQS